MGAPQHQLGVATTSQLAADAAAEVAELGGNAVDCAVAAAMCSINTQPGVCALAGGAFVSVWRPGKTPLTIDGNVAVPGMGLSPETSVQPESVTMDYGGGITTLVGTSSIAVPGTLKALYNAAEHFGSVSWRDLLEPTIRAAKAGFPLAAACHYYLGYAGRVIFGRSEDGYAALHHADGSLVDPGSPIVVPHLADSLMAIAQEGERVFYEGEIGRRIVGHVQSRGGLLSATDLQRYKAEVRKSLLVDIDDWQIALNPPPAIGGANLAALLLCFGTEQFSVWDADSLRRLLRAQQATMRYRRTNLDITQDVEPVALQMLALARSGELVSKYASASTVHTSAVDSSGLACAITASSGYGSGEMAPGTGLWLNNCLGELELNCLGLEAGPPGRRLPSNMAPGCARSKNAVLAIGSPGADRITTALHQFLVNFLQRGLDLRESVAHPRLHLRIDETASEIAAEPGIEMPDTEIPLRPYDELSMYFGGVAAALFDRDTGIDVAADPRREGGTFTLEQQGNG